MWQYKFESAKNLLSVSGYLNLKDVYLGNVMVNGNYRPVSIGFPCFLQERVRVIVLLVIREKIRANCD